MDNHETVIKIDEENEVKKQQFTKALVKKSKLNHIEKSFNSCPTTHKDCQNSTNGVANNDNSTKNEAHKHIESMETETNNPITSKNDNEEIKKQRSFQCGLCYKWYNTKKQITLHITNSHKSSTVKHSHRQSNKLHHNKCTEKFTKTINGPYKCDMCFKYFSSKSNLTKHKSVVKSLLNVICAKDYFL